MPTLIMKVTLLFLAALITLFAAKRATAAMRHLLCVCALAGSLLLPVTALFPARVIAVRLPAITIAASQAVARAESWSPSRVILGLWAFGALVLILRLAVGHWRISRLVRSATPIEPHALYMAEVGVPIVCGLLRPVVLMPRASSEWPVWQFDAAVRHELTHVRRKDLQANFIAQLACAAWWFHPLAWMLARYLRDCQETACDDAVLFSGLEPATYAQALLSVAQTVAQTPTPTLLPGCPMTTTTNLKTRITRLLDHSIARTTSRANLLRTAIGFAIVLAGVGVLSLQKSSAQAPPADKSDQVYKVGDGVTSPSVISKVDPQYTEDARKEKIAGSVMLSMVIGTDGLAHDISVTKSLDPGLDRKAAEAVEQWHFAPGALKGEPVAVQAVIEINFRLL
jgi:TonB family protein